MKVLVACEYTATVRDAFRRRGHDAWSCDLLPTEGDPLIHFERDIFDVLGMGWDLMIAHPPCTYLSHSGCRWLYHGGRKVNGKDPARWIAMEQAAIFFEALRTANIPRIAIENPQPHPHAEVFIGKSTQVIQPHQFGHPEFKGTHLWLTGLPFLKPTNVLRVPHKSTVEYVRWSKIHHASPGVNRGLDRSRSYQGIADAMAEQWGSL